MNPNTDVTPVPAGIIIWTSTVRFDEMAAFYEHTLGLRPASSRRGHIAFTHDGFRLTIGIHDGIRGRTADPLRIMINFSVPDIHARVADLEHAGVQVLRRPEQEAWGGWIATFEDPDGNVLQLLELPQATH